MRIASVFLFGKLSIVVNPLSFFLCLSGIRHLTRKSFLKHLLSKHLIHVSNFSNDNMIIPVRLRVSYTDGPYDLSIFDILLIKGYFSHFTETNLTEVSDKDHQRKRL